jgi:hypothetical protein
MRYRDAGHEAPFAGYRGRIACKELSLKRRAEVSAGKQAAMLPSAGTLPQRTKFFFWSAWSFPFAYSCAASAAAGGVT